MSCLQAILCIILPPLAVLDKGCGTFLIVTLLTFCGWVPGVLAALVVTSQPPQQQQVVYTNDPNLITAPKATQTSFLSILVLGFLVLGIFGNLVKKDQSPPQSQPPLKPIIVEEKEDENFQNKSDRQQYENLMKANDPKAALVFAKQNSKSSLKAKVLIEKLENNEKNIPAETTIQANFAFQIDATDDDGGTFRFVFLYKGPSGLSGLAGYTRHGEKVEIIEKTGDYVKVRKASEVSGWLVKSFVKHKTSRTIKYDSPKFSLARVS